MNRFLLLLCSCIAMTALSGCGPMQMPMPVRLEDEQKKNLDQSWDKALTPVGRFDHPTLLDAFLLTQAYQVGVDKLTFHSEKKVAAGTVVMDIEYDRLKPDQDRFEVKVFDPARNLLRQETYGRKEVQDAHGDLFVRFDALQRKADAGQATPQELQELAGLKARVDAITAIFPEDKAAGPAGKEKKP